MEREKLEGLLIDYIDGKLNSIDKHAIEQELMKNKESFKLYEQLKEVMQVMDQSNRIEPSDKLRLGFEMLLEEEMKHSAKGKTIFFQPHFYRVAAAVALLILGGAAGFWISRYQRQQAEIAQMKEEMQKTKELMMAMMSDEESPSQRILGVKAAYKTHQPDDEIVNALIKTLNDDPNSNVRLAALEALRKFTNEKKVKSALIQALSHQTDPVIQIALIQLMVQMKEKEAIKSLQKITEDEETLPAVKDEAYAGIFKLS
jgi:hypothetical protein